MSEKSLESKAADRQRWAELVLVSPTGKILGKLPPVAAGTPWWPEVESVVRAVRQHYDIDVTVLRLLAADRPRPPGGRVTYLAEVASPVEVEACDVVLDEQPLRAAYARPGGPAAELQWAFGILAAHGLSVAGLPVQVRTWNLSSLWRIPLEEKVVWLKSVPRFFAHEGELLAALGSGPHLPVLLGHGARRILLREIPGEDLYDASLAQRCGMIDVLVDLQHRWSEQVPKLLGLGLPDWRGPALRVAIESAFARTLPELGRAAVEVLESFIAGLDHRLAELATCGLPDTLVHGDFHAGNVRGGPDRLTLLDWADAGVGHPLLDQAAFLDRSPEAERPRLEAHWERSWRAAFPASNPSRARELLAPVAAARQAVTYCRFLDGIEPSEHPYHRADPAEWFNRTAKILTQNGMSSSEGAEVSS